MAVTEFDAPQILIRYHGLFVLPDLLKQTRSWFKKFKYLFEEKKHMFREDEREVEMSGKKKISEYVKYTIETVIKCTELSNVEVVREGGKIQMQKARVIIKISGVMKLDWQDRFGGNVFLQFLQDVYHRYIAGHTIDEEWMGKLIMEMTKLQRVIKTSLEVESA